MPPRTRRRSLSENFFRRRHNSSSDDKLAATIVVIIPRARALFACRWCGGLERALVDLVLSSAHAREGKRSAPTPDQAIAAVAPPTFIFAVQDLESRLK
jgi:hypothetical protein